MKDTIISLRIDKDLREKMKIHEEINWSVILRKAIIENLESKETVDLEKRKKAIEEMDKLVKIGAFNKGKDSVSIIREWRNKRR